MRTVRFIVRDWECGHETTDTTFRTVDAPCPPELERLLVEHEAALLKYPATKGHWTRSIIGVEVLPQSPPLAQEAGR